MEAEKNSKLGVIALILSILGCTSLIGVILAIVDLTKKDGHKKTCSIIALIIGIIFLVAGTALTTGDSKTETDKEEVAVEETVKVPETKVIETVETEPVVKTEPVVAEPVIEEETEDNVPMGHKNAVRKAESYLSFTAFSYKGLIEQLEYEGFTKEEATYGADNVDADWNEQAAKKAQSYLDMTAFSKDGLIEQLEYEGFTKEEATYGAESVGF